MRLHYDLTNAKGEAYDVEVDVATEGKALDNLVTHLANRAMNKKSKKAAAAHGVVSVVVRKKD